ncbi:unnamed protein product, partial [Bubo scandiacus]
MLNIASAKILVPGGLLFPKADNKEENHNSSHLPGHFHGQGTAARNRQDRHHTEQMCVTL